MTGFNGTPDPTPETASAKDAGEGSFRFEHDGERFVIRAICPEDAAAHAAFLARLSVEDLRLRFFIPTKSLPVKQIARMTGVDHEREMAFIALRKNNETAGAVRLIRDAADGTNAEIAIIVDAAAKHKGVAERLMHAIINWGTSRGVTHVNARILAENLPMLAFVRHLGFTLKPCADEPNIMQADFDCGEDQPVPAG